MCDGGAVHRRACERASGVPDPLLAHGLHKVPDAGLGEVLLVVLDEFGVDGGDGHEHVHHGSLGAQQVLPHLCVLKDKNLRYVLK